MTDYRIDPNADPHSVCKHDLNGLTDTEANHHRRKCEAQWMVAHQIGAIKE